MISLKALSRITTSVKKGRPTVVFELVKPMREWAYCLLLATLIAISLIAYIGFDFYSQLHTTDISITDQHHKRSPYNVELGKNVLSIYKERAERFDALLKESAPTPVPVVQTSEAISQGSETLVGEEESPELSPGQVAPVLESVQ